MSLWRQTPDLEQLNASQKNSIGDLLGIRFEAFDDESLTASMPVDSRTHQPFGLLHGGASVVLAESLGSMASYLCVDTSQYYCVGLVLVQETWAVDNGFLTPTLKIKRNMVEGAYGSRFHEWVERREAVLWHE